MKPLKAYAVVWTPKGMKDYGVESKDRIVCVEPKEDIPVNISKHKTGRTGRPKIRYTDTSAIFDERREAEAFRAGNEDWEVAPITITLSKPK